MTNKLEKIKIEKKFLDEICKKWNLSEFSLFGSYANKTNTESSDIDILIDFKKEKKLGLFELIQIQNELENYFQKKVDLVTKNSILNSKNMFIKNDIMKKKVVLYESK